MPQETTTKKMDSKAMKAQILSKEPTGGGVIWNGHLITDVKDVPTDEEILAADKEHRNTVANRK